MKQKINWDKYFKRNKVKQKSPLDINGLFPGYFNKNVFRGVILSIILLAVFTMQTNNWETNFKYVECPADVLTVCEYLTPSDNISQGLQTIYLNPGEVLGNKPNKDYYNYPVRVKALFLFGFVLNHLLYFFRSKKFKIPVNKDKWDKIKEDFKKK